MLSEVSRCQTSFSLEHLGLLPSCPGAPGLPRALPTPPPPGMCSLNRLPKFQRDDKLPRASLRKCWSLGCCPHGHGPQRCWKEEPMRRRSHPACPDRVGRVRPPEAEPRQGEPSKRPTGAHACDTPKCEGLRREGFSRSLVAAASDGKQGPFS